jgi:ABC-2 type transport system permease protein
VHRRTGPPGTAPERIQGRRAVTVTAPAAVTGRREGRPPDAAPFAGTATLLRLDLRRDRLMIASWVAVIGVFVAFTAVAFADSYPTVAERIPFAGTIRNNAGLVAITGEPFDLLTTGGLTAWRIGALCGALAGIMSYLLVVRHTLAEEETGLLERVGPAAVGRRAPLTAALLVALIADAATASVVAVPLAAGGLPVGGAVALGLAIAAAGLVFAAVAAVTAQLAQTSRGANGLAATLLGAAYVLRGIGDSTGPGWLSWASPLGWSLQVRPFAGERWWVLALHAAVVVALVAGAYALSARRDLGEGAIPARPGRAAAAPALDGPFALAWRLQRGALLGWAAGFAVLGLIYGGVAESAADILRESPQLADTLRSLGIDPSTAVDSYLATTIAFGGILAGAYATQAVLRLRGEETSGTAESLLSVPLHRLTWVAAHLSVALVGSALLVAVMGAGAGVTHGMAVGDVGGELSRLSRPAWRRRRPRGCSPASRSPCSACCRAGRR